jgi:hypothetical protein
VRVAIRSVPTPGYDEQFTIEVEGSVGRAHSRLQLQGVSERLEDFALFSDGSWSEVAPVGGATIRGRVHANGDLHVRSSGGTLSIDAPAITATGRVLSSIDLFGHAAPAGGVVRLRTAVGTFATMHDPAGEAHFDSRHGNWANRTPVGGATGAFDRWGSVVRDGGLGAARWDAPPLAALAASGWYDRHAGLRLRDGDVQLDALGNDVSETIGGSVRTVQFWNPALGESVTVQELDLTRLAANGHVPANGIIHADVPIRIVRATQIPMDLTIVCSSSIYTKGSFNRVQPRAALLVAGGRIWHLSNDWSDRDELAKGPTAVRRAADGETVIRAARVDGVPAIGTAHYADLDGDGVRDDPNAGDAVATAAALLEAWGENAKLRIIGPTAHLQCADMADNPYNAGKRAEEISWIRWQAYSAPSLDVELESGFGTDAVPPLPLRVGRVLSRQEIGT